MKVIHHGTWQPHHAGHHRGPGSVIRLVREGEKEDQEEQSAGRLAARSTRVRRTHSSLISHGRQVEVSVSLSSGQTRQADHQRLPTPSRRGASHRPPPPCRLATLPTTRSGSSNNRSQCDVLEVNVRLNEPLLGKKTKKGDFGSEDYSYYILVNFTHSIASIQPPPS
ncbi:hypothetical protein E2C01_047864 [Portunus trituberculatus]|uniref:Uncharacterized protein n=1 Tax=Portunus trituberculatus TaxID=210409 RepID=A0A5B7G8M2_PORTR|nr:hypothetical protein [Portunus trituberculatus]